MGSFQTILCLLYFSGVCNPFTLSLGGCTGFRTRHGVLLVHDIHPAQQTCTDPVIHYIYIHKHTYIYILYTYLCMIVYVYLYFVVNIQSTFKNAELKYRCDRLLVCVYILRISCLTGVDWVKLG